MRDVLRALGLALSVLLLVGCASGARPTGAPAPAGSTAPTGSPAATPSATGPTRAPGSTPPPVAGGVPVRLSVPRLGLDERLIGLGIAPDGALEVPADPARVGWFTGGGRPGGPGPTVLAGHLDSLDGPAVFAELSALRPGDTVTVTTRGAGPVRYRVDRVEEHAKAEFPTEAVFGATARDELRLITCRDWDAQQGTYAGNLVVSAVALSGS